MNAYNTILNLEFFVMNKFLYLFLSFFFTALIHSNESEHEKIVCEVLERQLKAKRIQIVQSKQNFLSHIKEYWEIKKIVDQHVDNENQSESE